MFATQWMLSAVSFLAQGVPAVPATPPVPSRPAVVVRIPALAMPVAPAMPALAALSSNFASLTQLADFSQLADLSTLGESLAPLAQLSELAEFAEPTLAVPAMVWDEQDPSDSLYRAARRLLNRNRYTEAAGAFAEVIRRYPRSGNAQDAYYWQAFALYRTGDASNYRQARTLLEYQKAHYPHARTVADADALYARIQGELARQGDEDAARWVREHAAGNPPTGGGPTQAGPTTAGPTTAGCARDDDDDPRIAALNALLQMDADDAVPILKQILARRDTCSLVLRRKAVFIVSQKHTEETEDILLAAARNDPDQEVREQAVFWLSQVGSERAVTALDSILHSSSDPEIQKKAIFAISQIHSPRAGQILRDYAMRTDASTESRADAIFWLGQQRSSENAAFLRGLYAQLTDDDLKEKVIFSLSQMGGTENGRWLLDLATNEHEPIEMRKKALFWAGQMGVALPDLAAIYDRTTNLEMKEQLIFVYSQRDEPAAVDKLIDIAKHDPNSDLRKKAVFWLGQSHDPRARQALLDIINQ